MKKRNNKFWEKDITKWALVLAFFFLFLTMVFFIGDWLDLAEGLGLHLRFDWAANLCMFLSAFASIVLGSVAIIQNKRAEGMNKQLAKINQDQFEVSIINNNYPMMKFCDLQRIEKDKNGGREFVFRFFDTRNIPLKEAYTRNIVFVPLADKYKNEETPRRIIMRRTEKKDTLQFTYLHESIDNGLYMIRVPMKEMMFDGYRYCRVELEVDLISTTGVVTRCKAYALLDAKSNHKGMPGREYPHVYHQFFEIKNIVSEQKYNKLIRQLLID